VFRAAELYWRVRTRPHPKAQKTTYHRVQVGLWCGESIPYPVIRNLIMGSIVTPPPQLNLGQSLARKEYGAF